MPGTRPLSHDTDSFLLVGPAELSNGRIACWLRAHGHAVTACGYGEAARRALLSDPDVILVDMADAPRAREAAERLRELPTGDMYTLIALGCAPAWPAADFDIVVECLAAYGELMASLADLDEAWTVRLPGLAKTA